MLRPTFSRTTALLAGVTGVAVAALVRSRSSASAAAMAAVPQAQVRRAQTPREPPLAAAQAVLSARASHNLEFYHV